MLGQFVSLLGHMVKRWLPLLLTLAVCVALWTLIAELALYPRFMIPHPGEVLDAFLRVTRSGRLWREAWVTLQEVLLGLALGASIGALLGYALAKSRGAERALTPYIVALQAVPIVAIAPLLMIWFGSGLESKVIIGALIVFFPMVINTLIGIRNVDADLRALMRALHATRWQTFWHLELPAALPVLLGGLKVSATLAVIGAIVGEFVAASAGLGLLLKEARGRFDTPTVIVAVLTLTAMALTLYGIVGALERRLLAWQRAGRAEL